MKPIVYIDGREGTTGLQIHERLGTREDLELLLIDEEKRKDPGERKKCINAADIIFLCLPDDAAREAVMMTENPKTRLIDASTAHRTASGWAYGFPELSGAHREAVRTSARVANPGCHATGFLVSAYPLVAMGILPRDYPLTCFSLTGYSGGGKKLIAEFEAEGRDKALDSPNIYATSLNHKHLPEMQKVAGLEFPPVFVPVLGDIYKGMATGLMLQNRRLAGAPTAKEIWEKFCGYYKGEPLITVAPFGGDTPRLATNALSGLDTLKLTISGNDEQTLVTAQFDNLGKGASGAAVQNMNLMLGLPETTGLIL